MKFIAFKKINFFRLSNLQVLSSKFQNFEVFDKCQVFKIFETIGVRFSKILSTVELLRKKKNHCINKFKFQKIFKIIWDRFSKNFYQLSNSGKKILTKKIQL